MSAPDQEQQSYQLLWFYCDPCDQYFALADFNDPTGEAPNYWADAYVTEGLRPLCPDPNCPTHLYEGDSSAAILLGVGDTLADAMERPE